MTRKSSLRPTAGGGPPPAEASTPPIASLTALWLAVALGAAWAARRALRGVRPDGGDASRRR